MRASRWRLYKLTPNRSNMNQNVPFRPFLDPWATTGVWGGEKSRTLVPKNGPWGLGWTKGTYWKMSPRRPKVSYPVARGRGGGPKKTYHGAERLVPCFGDPPEEHPPLRLYFLDILAQSHAFYYVFLPSGRQGVGGRGVGERVNPPQGFERERRVLRVGGRRSKRPEA